MNNVTVLVVGTPRSGTTLTAKIRGRHSKIFMLAETCYYDDVFFRAGQNYDISEPGVSI